MSSYMWLLLTYDRPTFLDKLKEIDFLFLVDFAIRQNSKSKKKSLHTVLKKQTKHFVIATLCNFRLLELLRYKKFP